MMIVYDASNCFSYVSYTWLWSSSQAWKLVCLPVLGLMIVPALRAGHVIVRSSWACHGWSYTWWELSWFVGDLSWYAAREPWLLWAMQKPILVATMWAQQSAVVVTSGSRTHHGCHAEPKSPSQLFSGARESVRLTVQGLRAILVVSWGPQRAYRD